jgi:hypothetical protein
MSGRFAPAHCPKLGYDEVLGEGKINFRDFETYYPRIIQLDLLKDWIFDLQAAYDRILADKFDEKPDRLLTDEL